MSNKPILYLIFLYSALQQIFSVPSGNLLWSSVKKYIKSQITLNGLLVDKNYSQDLWSLKHFIHFLQKKKDKKVIVPPFHSAMCLPKNWFLLSCRCAGFLSWGQGHSVRRVSGKTESKDTPFDGSEETCAYPFLYLVFFICLHTGLLQALNKDIVSSRLACVKFSFNSPHALWDSSFWQLNSLNFIKPLLNHNSPFETIAIGITLQNCINFYHHSIEGQRLNQ